MLNPEMIHAARERIGSRIHRTPVVTSRQFNEVAGKEVFFKCENLQRAGAFKIRGATNKIRSLSDDEKSRGIVAFSSGNHAQAVALAGREAGVRVLVAMPEDAPKAKVAATRDYGAEIIFYDRHHQDRLMAALSGVNVDRTISLTFVLGAMLAAVAGLLAACAALSHGDAGARRCPAVRRRRCPAVRRRRARLRRCPGRQAPAATSYSLAWSATSSRASRNLFTA